uniref:Ig-like domain-containing protein n=1 Tax=Oryzias latipes TaxID=8090 RepID=A0A3P9J5F5_ORYLA
MSASSAFLTVPLLVSLRVFEVNSCNYTCPDKPVFTPSSLVVKYGDPAFATCVACQSDCDESLANLEAAGLKEKNGRTLKWKVNSLTEWKSDPICYNIDHNGTQCCSTLKVTLYQMPTNVSISVLNHSGPMLEKSRYDLVCEVRDVAPAENLTVTFYRGQTELGKAQFSRSTSKKPKNGSFSLSFKATKEDDGAQFSCGAKLELGPEGPQRPLVVRSQSLTATVHYGPELQNEVNQISIYEGETLQLNCSSVGNPSPSYTWILPFNDSSPASSVLTFKSANFKHEGQYNCTVSNSVMAVSVIFEVDVQVNFLPYIIAAAVVLAAVVLTIVAAKIYCCYKHKYMRDYNLKDVFRLRRHPSQGPY